MTSQSAVQTTQYLLNVLRPNQQPESWRKLSQTIDWDDFAVRAIAFGLAPQIWHRLKAWRMDLPAKPMAKLSVTYAAQARRSEAIDAQLGQVLAALAEESIQPICLKGVHLAACYYPEPALRPMNDIDLLFKPELLATAERVLLDLGYGGKHKPADRGARVTKHTSTYRRTNNAAQTRKTVNPYLSASLDRTVEPHSSLEESWFGLKADITPGIWSRAETAVLANQPCLVLCPEDLLHHVCVHFTFHLIQGAPAFVQLTDVLIITQNAKLDWTAFLQRVDSANTAAYVLAALRLAQKIIGAAPPVPAMAQLAAKVPAGLRQRIDSLDLSYMLRRTQQKPLVTLGDRLKRGVTDRLEIARWAPTLAGKLRVWQTAVQFTRTDTAQLLKK